MKVKYGIAGGFTEKQLKQICEEALQVLEKVGMDVPHKGVLKLLAAHKGITIKNTRVYFSPWLGEEYLQRFRKEEQARPAEEKFKMEGSWYCANVLDIDTGKIRRSHSQDLIQAVKMCQILDASRAVAPVAPLDVPISLQALTAWKICLENSSCMGGAPVTDVRVADYVQKMLQVVGRKGPVWCEEITISPLRLNSQALELVYYFLDKGMIVEGEPGPMISAGATAPIFTPAFFVQGVAEWLGAYIVLKIISHDRQGNSTYFRTLFNGGLRFEPMHFDMRYSSIAFGSAESLLFRLMTRQIFRYLGCVPPIGGAFRSASKEVDAQAAAERAMNVLVEALDGVRIFAGAGMLSIDEVFSPEQLVIDKEILNYISRVIEGIEFREEKGLSLEVIKEGVARGGYLDHLTTVEGFREIYWLPTLFEHLTLRQWQGKGMTSLRQKVKAEIEQRVREYYFELDKDVQRELNKIYTFACNELG